MDMLLNLPSRDPACFSRCASPSSSQASGSPRTYIATHDRTEAPVDQVICTESTSILVREFERLGDKQAERKACKRAAADKTLQSAARKNPRRNCIYDGNYRDMQEGITQFC